MLIFMSMGHIYQIRNTITNAVYIGSILKRDPRHRWMRHRKDLRGNHHHSQHLQRAWNKYGELAFVFEVIEQVDGDVIPREQWHLDNRKNNYLPHLNYNVCWIAGNCAGRKWSAEMKRKLSKSHMGQKQTPEAKAQQQTTWANKCKHPYSFTSPDGTVYNDIRNLRAFARGHNLGPNGRVLTQLHRGEIRYYKGWTKTGSKPPLYELYSPEGYYFQGMILKDLCRKNGINYKMIHKYCIKMNKPYQGWIAKRLA